MIRFRPHKEHVTATIEAAPRCIRSLEERMASDMRELAFGDRTVSAETLRERGWTDAVIQRLAPAALAIARRQSIRQVI